MNDHLFDLCEFRAELRGRAIFSDFVSVKLVQTIAKINFFYIEETSSALLISCQKQAGFFNKLLGFLISTAVFLPQETIGSMSALRD